MTDILNQPPIQLISLLIQSIEKMDTINEQPEDVKQRWVEVIAGAVTAGKEYIQYHSASQALNAMGTVEQSQHKTFV